MDEGTRYREKVKGEDRKDAKRRERRVQDSNHFFLFFLSFFFHLFIFISGRNHMEERKRKEERKETTSKVEESLEGSVVYKRRITVSKRYLVTQRRELDFERVESKIRIELGRDPFSHENRKMPNELPMRFDAMSLV